MEWQSDPDTLYPANWRSGLSGAWEEGVFGQVSWAAEDVRVEAVGTLCYRRVFKRRDPPTKGERRRSSITAS